ncbi:MAG: magnesium chelatase subunit D [Pseudomonadota bacterium]
MNDPVTDDPLLDPDDADQALLDHSLAVQLFCNDPLGFRGICLRGFGPVRDALVINMVERLGADHPVVKIPINVDNERLLGGVDLTATLASGRRVERAGLIEQARGGILLIPMAERMAEDVAAHIAQALDTHEMAVILLDDSVETDEAPSRALIERIAFRCDLGRIRSLDIAELAPAPPESKNARLTKKQQKSLAVTAAMLGIYSVRPLLFAQNVARRHAALFGESSADDADLAAAVRLVLAPRATQLPPAEPSPEEQPPPEDEPPPEEPEDDPGDGDEEQSLEDIPLEDILLKAAVAAIPPDILDQIKDNIRSGGPSSAGKSGQKSKSTMRGRPLGTRPGIPGNGKRLALIDSLRAAAPWQTIRRNSTQAADQDADPDKIHIRKSDLRVRHFEERRESLTIFAVDASGSSALARLAEAKGAVELMLAEAYIKRSQVALIAFRQNGAEILLPPTRSLTRARRALSALPGGGGTPLAAGLIAAQQLAEAAVKRGQTPTIALLTDGKANVLGDGTPDRKGAMEEAENAARAIAAQALPAIVLDISPRPRPEAAALAAALRGRYFPLPRAQSAAMVEAIESVGQDQS